MNLCRTTLRRWPDRAVILPMYTVQYLPLKILLVWGWLG